MKKRSLYYLIIILISLVPGILINTPTSYIPVFFLLFLLVFSILYALALTHSFHIHIQDEQSLSISRGEELSIPVSIQNSGFLVFPRITLTLSLQNAQSIRLGETHHTFVLKPKERKILQLPASFAHVGNYHVCIDNIRIHDFLGVFSKQVPPCTSQEIQVFPKLYEIARTPFQILRGIEEQDHHSIVKVHDGTFTDVRAYTLGDPIKSIHWKLSAHTGQYMTRIIEPDAINGLSIYMDHSPHKNDDYENFACRYDCVMESACSIARHALDQSHLVEFLYTEKEQTQIIPIRDKMQLTNAAAHLPPLSSSTMQMELDDIISRHSSSRSSYDNIIVLTSHLSRRLINTLLTCRQSGKQALLCYIRLQAEKPKDKQINKELFSLLYANGVSCHSIASAEEFAAVLGASQ